MQCICLGGCWNYGRIMGNFIGRSRILRVVRLSVDPTLPRLLPAASLEYTPPPKYQTTSFIILFTLRTPKRSQCPFSDLPATTPVPSTTPCMAQMRTCGTRDRAWTLCEMYLQLTEDTRTDHSHYITRITMVNHKTTLSTIRRIPLLNNKAGNMCSPLLVEDMLITQQKQEYGKRKENQWSISQSVSRRLRPWIFWCLEQG